MKATSSSSCSGRAPSRPRRSRHDDGVRRCDSRLATCDERLMKILSITAGAAGMYCGSCFRDNALAAELAARGHDVSLVPMYTPVRTDEPSVSAGRRVLFGGISVYLQQQSAIFRRTPRLLDRLWDSP